MSCSFNVPLDGIELSSSLAKAKEYVVSNGGTFDGDDKAGNFNISLFGNTVAGNYKASASEVSIEITDKPFMVPCSMIESFLKQKMTEV